MAREQFQLRSGERSVIQPALRQTSWYRPVPKLDLKIGLDANAVVITDKTTEQTQ
ncbi:hypothetical protein [Caballeronia sp. BR00000012568055]|uniref:hypothetical protein n=1 Tax=Caballeronia sp. BR00000012568055 TaxID=2918761 RepID=UPI0023F6C547|nr:hypothetical protein [Caballeronia sp. BR00000012568055]